MVMPRRRRFKNYGKYEPQPKLDKKVSAESVEDRLNGGKKNTPTERSSKETK